MTLPRLPLPRLAAAAIMLAASALPATAAWSPNDRVPVFHHTAGLPYSAAAEADCRALSAYLDKLHPRPPIHLGCHHVAY